MDVNSYAIVAATASQGRTWNDAYRAWKLRRAGVTAKEAASLINCSPQSVLNWERDINERLARLETPVKESSDGNQQPQAH